MKQLVVLLLFLGTAATATAQVKTHSLYDDCKVAIRFMDDNTSTNPADTMSDGFCSGYLRGFADGLTVTNSTTTVNSQVTVEALVRSFVNYVNAHPAEMDYPDIRIVLQKAWVADNIITITKVSK